MVRTPVHPGIANICKNAVLSYEGIIEGPVLGTIVRARRHGPRLARDTCVTITANGVSQNFVPSEGQWFVQTILRDQPLCH